MVREIGNTEISDTLDPQKHTSHTPLRPPLNIYLYMKQFCLKDRTTCTIRFETDLYSGIGPRKTI